MGDLYEQNGVYYKKFTEIPFTGDVTGKDQGRLENGLKEGFWSYFYSSGPLMRKGEYKNGLREGSWVNYHKNGRIGWKRDYKNNRQDGSSVLYYRDGTLMSKGTYKNGLREGYWLDREVPTTERGGKSFYALIFTAVPRDTFDDIVACWKEFGVLEKGYFKDGKVEGLTDYICLNKDGTEGRLLVRLKERVTERRWR